MDSGGLENGCSSLAETGTQGKGGGRGRRIRRGISRRAGALMWYTRRLRVAVGGGASREAVGGNPIAPGEDEQLMQPQGAAASGGSGEVRTLRRKPQLHVNCSKGKFPPHPGGVGR